MNVVRGRRPERVKYWITATIVAAASFLVPMPAWIVDEFYSRDLYPWVQNGLTAVSNLLPVAVLDLMIVAAVAAVVYRLVRLGLQAWRDGVLAAVWEGGRRVLRAAAIVGIIFMWAWGCNYRRVPLQNSLGKGGEVAATVAGLRLAVSDANAVATRLRPALTAAPVPTYPELADMLRAPMNTALTRLNREPLSRPGRPKFSAILTPFFTWSGVDGMINPLVLESIVNPDLLPFERGYVLAHEWGHLAGQADEAEASAVGWFACMNGPPALAYSASLYLILEAAGNLPAEIRRKAYADLDLGVRSDLEAIGRRMRQQKPQVQRAASEVYDQYLKANRVADGNASYSRALRLILATPIRDALNDYKAKGR